jgi:folate-binding protein YgfZ
MIRLPAEQPATVSSIPNPDGAPDYLAAKRDLAHRYRDSGIVSVEGLDRVAFLQGQLTQDVGGLSAFEARLAAGLTPTGKLLYFGRVLALPDRLLLLLPSPALVVAVPHLSKYAVFQKVSVRDVSADHLRLALYGPRAGSVALPEGAVRLPPDRDIAAEVLAPATARPAVDAALLASASVLLRPASADVLRVEAGRPRFGQDADSTNLPDEVGLADAISATKGCYVGQEVVARLRTYGQVARRLVGFLFPDAWLPAGTVFPDPDRPGRTLGRVTSSVESPRFGAIGLGLVARGVPEAARLAAAGGLAIVTGLPFA